jgi:hypothetical protein
VVIFKQAKMMKEFLDWSLGFELTTLSIRLEMLQITSDSMEQVKKDTKENSLVKVKIVNSKDDTD